MGELFRTKVAANRAGRGSLLILRRLWLGLEWALLILGVMLSLYTFAYLALLKKGTFASFSPNGLEVVCIPDYKLLPASFFTPIHDLDRRYFRKKSWSRVWSLPVFDVPSPGNQTRP
jgi:hypothetical protein